MELLINYKTKDFGGARAPQNCKSADNENKCLNMKKLEKYEHDIVV